MVYEVVSSGNTYTTKYTELENFGSSAYYEGVLTASRVLSESGKESFALIEIENGKVTSFENAFDKPCLLAAYHDRIKTGEGQGMTEDVLTYLNRIGVSF